MTSGMPGVPHALMQAISLSGTIVADRGRSDVFARLVDTGTLADAAGPAGASSTTAGIDHSIRASANRSAPSVNPKRSPTRTVVSSKPKPSASEQSEPDRRRIGSSKTDRNEAESEPLSTTKATQPDPAPITPIPIVESIPTVVASTISSDTAAEVAGPAQSNPAAHRTSVNHADGPGPRPDGVRPEPVQAQSAAAQHPQVASPTISTAPVAPAAQPSSVAAMTHAAPPGAKMEAAGPISASSPTAVTTPATAPAPTPVTPAVVVSTHIASPQQLIIHLTPPELGKLEVRIDRPADAPTRVEIKVEHAHTLDLLSQDQPRLQQALDQAGIPAHRQVVLTLSENSRGFDGSNADRPSGSTSHAGPDGSGAEVAESELPNAPRWVCSTLDIMA